MKKRAKNDIDKVYSQYQKSVNMTYAQMLKWARNPWSNKASLSRAPITRNLKLLKKKKSAWTLHDCREAKKTIAFNARMRKVKSGKPVRKDIQLSKRDISLRNWAYNPKKRVPL